MMTDLVPTELIEHGSEIRPGGGTRRREAPTARSCGARATVPIQAEEFRAELACGRRQACPEPYEEGFGAYASGAGLPDNPYHGDNCAHQQWANGWSQARDEAQRQARQQP
jgi:hypothetical protein